MKVKLPELLRKHADMTKAAEEFATRADWADEDQLELDNQIKSIESLALRIKALKALQKKEAQEAEEDTKEDDEDQEDDEDKDENDDEEKSHGARVVRKNFRDLKAKGQRHFAEARRNSAPVQKGHAAAQFLIGISQGRTAKGAAEFVENRFKNAEVANHVHKALSYSGGMSSGGVLIPSVLSNELIELLRSEVAVEKLGPQQIGLDAGNVRIPRLATTVSSTWQGENVDITSSQPSLDYVDLAAKKLTTNVPISNDLIRRAPIGVEGMVLDDLIASIARKLDVAYIRGDGTNGSPTGLLNQSGISKSDVTSNAGSLDDVVAVLKGMKAQLMRGNSRMIRPGFILHSDVMNFIASKRDSVGGWFRYAEELDAGKLEGVPFAISNQVPVNLANVGGTARTKGTEIYLADFADVLVGNTLNVQVETSREASYVEGGNLTSAWARDTTAFRVITEVDLALRHPESVAVRRVDSWTF